MADQLPSAQDFFGAPPPPPAQPNALENVGNALVNAVDPRAGQVFGPQSKPTADEFFGPEQDPWKITQNALDPNLSPREHSEAANAFWEKTAAGRIGTQMATGFMQPLVSGTPETDDMMKKLGIYNDVSKGQNDLIKSFNEVMMKPVITGLAALFGAQGAGIQQAANEAGEPVLPEALMGETGTGTFPHLPEPIAQAKTAGVLDSEGVYMGTEARTPAQEDAAHIAAYSLPEARTATFEQANNAYNSANKLTPESFEALQKTFPADLNERLIDYATPAERRDILSRVPSPSDKEFNPNDKLIDYATPEEKAAIISRVSTDANGNYISPLDRMARNVAPEAFQQKEQLEGQKIQLSKQLEAARSEYQAPIQAKIDEILGKVNGIESRLTKVKASTLADLREQLTGQNDEMSAIRQQVLETTHKLWDIGPDIYKARQTASEFLPPENTIDNENLASSAETENAQEPKNTETEQQTNQKKPDENPKQPDQPAQPSVNIESEISKKLSDAGRPQEEADASGKIWGWYYKTLAEDLGNGKTAEDLYKEDNLNVKNLARGQADPLNPTPGKQGSINLSTGLVKLFKNADASTFMHETAHKWLDDIMHYASQDGANEIIKSRAETVRNWLGMKEGEELTTRQHEKFARSFERYLSEGIAPSRELASVFAKFKQWISGLVNAAQKAKYDINDDIRGVFDRLLSTNPEKTFIAPDEAQAPEAAPNTEAVPGEPTNNGPQQEPVAQSTQPVGDIVQISDVAKKSPPPNMPPENQVGGASVNKWGDTSLLDKAGNIRLDLLTDEQSDREALKQLAMANNNFGYATRGVITDQEVSELATDLNVNNGDVNLEKLRQMSLEDGVPLAARIKAGRMMLQQVNKAVQDAGARVRAEGTDEAIAELLLQRNRFLRTAETVSGITAEWGRAGRAFADISKEDVKASMKTAELFQQITGATRKDVVKMARAMVKIPTDQGIAGYMKDSFKPDFWDKLIEYRNNNLLSGPITHLYYLEGGFMNALYKPLIQMPAGAIVQGAREAFGATIPDEERIQLGEAGAMLHALQQGSINGWKAATASWEGGTGFTAIKGPLGQVVNIPTRVISSVHAFQYSLRFEQNMAAEAWRSASKAGLEENSPEFAKHMVEFKSNPTKEIMDKVSEDTKKDIFRAPIDQKSTIGKISNLASTTKVGKLLFPFVKMQYNIAKTVAENSPLAFLSEDARANLSGINGQAAKDMQMGQIAAGTAVAGIGFAMTAAGLNNGSGPKDINEYRIWRLTHMPNCIQVGNLAIPHKALGILGELLNMGANLHESVDGMSHGDVAHAAALFIEKVGSSFTDNGFANQLKDITDAVFHKDQYGAHFVQSLATQLTPYSVGMGQINSAFIDPFARDVHSRGTDNFYGILDAAKSKIPGLSETLEPKRDLFGEPIHSRMNYELYKNDPVIQRMNALGVGIGTLDRKIRGVTLTPEQYDQYGKVAGRFTKMRLTNLVQPGFEKLPPQIQIKLIDRNITESRELAAKYVMASNPSIMMQAQKNKAFITK